MSRESARRPTRALTGIVLVDKPSGSTSNRVLQRVKRLFQAEKAGHTGTLDPIATGMLPVCFGAATKISGLMLDASKRYRVTAAFGVATDTGDAAGSAIERHEGPALSRDEIEAAVGAMTGRIRQIPPMYSAVKHEGRRLYELAREGREVPRRARDIEIFDLSVESLDWPQLTLSVHCSKGTYVRTLVADLACKLGTVAHVAALRRLSVGPFGEDLMVGLDALERAAVEGLTGLDRWLLGADAALPEMPAVGIGEQDCEALRHGRRVPLTAAGPEGRVRIYDPDGRFIGIGEIDEGGWLRPAGIFPR
ncbi:MAG TPA: tRNA pseudouridine(55) synthase TruB [Gammaproteobacteria bacterium]|nr:tRNA pseudouridine(55) synthase TruB [Gammaproteobacteria bacterium]